MKKIIYTLVVALLPVTTIFAQIDRKQPPKALPERSVNFGKTENFTLSNGLKVIVIENHKLPTVRVDITLNIVAVKQGDKAGYLDMFGSMLRAGTQNYTKEKLDEQIDYLGSDFYTGRTYLGVSSLKKQVRPSMDILKELLYYATFTNQEELDRLKKQSKTALEAVDKNPDVISQRVQSILLYGKDDAWGEYETEKSIDNIVLSDFKNYYNTYFKPNVAYVTIVGDITLAEAKALANEYFSSWKSGEVKQDVPKLKKNTSGMKIAFVNLPSASQSSINIIGLTELKKSDKNYIPAILGNSILGDGASGRLFKDIREKHGWTYGAYSTLKDNYKRLGSFGAYAKVRNDVTDSAVVEFIRNIKEIISQKPTEEELNLKKAEYSGNFALELEKPETVAEYVRTQMIENLPTDFYVNFLKNLNKISAQEIPGSLKQTIDPDNLTILIVGKGEEVLPRLEKLGYPIEYYDKFGNPAIKVAAVKEAGSVTLNQVLNTYYKAVAGSKEKLEQVKSVIMEAEMNLSQLPMPASLVYKFQHPNKIITIISIMGQTIKQGFDGEKGFSTMGNLTEEQVKEFSAQKGFFPELYYTEQKAVLNGIATIDGKEFYKIIVTDGKNKKIVYYDTNTGLKFREESQSEESGSTVTDYTDYKEFSGLKFPAKIITTMAKPDSSDVEIMTQTVKKYIINPSLTNADFKL